MKSFLAAVVVAFALAACASLVLNAMQEPAEKAYATTGARI